MLIYSNGAEKYVIQLRTSNTVTRRRYDMFCAIHASAFYAHYNDVIMSAMASQNTSLTMIYSTVYWDADQRKYQSSASPAFVRGIHRSPVNSPDKGPVMREVFPFDDVIMESQQQEHVDEKEKSAQSLTGNRRHLGPLLLTWFNFNPSLVKCGMKLLILPKLHKCNCWILGMNM